MARTKIRASAPTTTDVLMASVPLVCFPRPQRRGSLLAVLVLVVVGLNPSVLGDGVARLSEERQAEPRPIDARHALDRWLFKPLFILSQRGNERHSSARPPLSWRGRYKLCSSPTRKIYTRGEKIRSAISDLLRKKNLRRPSRELSARRDPAIPEPKQSSGARILSSPLLRDETRRPH